MIANTKDRQQGRTLLWQRTFEQMLPEIRLAAEHALARLAFDQRQALVARAIPKALAVFVALAERGKTAIAYPTPLALAAVKAVRADRRRACHEALGSPVAHNSRSPRLTLHGYGE